MFSTIEEALDGYWNGWLKELERRLRDVRGGREINQYFSVPEPEDHIDDYDPILAMACMSVDDIIELSEDEFAMYVMDQWSWKSNFTRTTTMYTGRRRREAGSSTPTPARSRANSGSGGNREVRRSTLAIVQLGELDDLGMTDIVDVRLEWDDAGWMTAAKRSQQCRLGCHDPAAMDRSTPRREAADTPCCRDQRGRDSGNWRASGDRTGPSVSFRSAPGGSRRCLWRCRSATPSSRGDHCWLSVSHRPSRPCPSQFRLGQGWRPRESSGDWAPANLDAVYTYPDQWRQGLGPRFYLPNVRGALRGFERTF